MRRKNKSLKKVWSDVDYKNKRIKKLFQSMRKCMNKPETILNNILQSLLKNQYKFVGDGQIILDGFNPDFIHKRKKKIIELYGDYWHNRKEVKIRDNKRLKSYKKHKYEILIIWEHEVRDLDYVSGKVITFNEN